VIFQSLIALYDRLDTAGNVPPFGFSKEDIGFVLTIDKNGNLVGQPEDLRKKVNATKFLFRKSIVPYTNKVNVRSGKGAQETSNFMVDKADYVFGMSGRSPKNGHRQSFLYLIDEVCKNSSDEGVVAVKTFLDKWNPEDSIDLENWKEICGTHGKWVAFRLKGDAGFVHERVEVQKLWSDFINKEKYPQGRCFVDGKEHGIQHQYSQFKFGSGASLVSFNEVAYESYNKSKGENAPISVEAEFKSSSALKFLFGNTAQRLWIGDAITVFWGEKKTHMEAVFGQILNPSVEDQEANAQVQEFLKIVRKGRLPKDIENDENIKFYIMGLSPNKARLALRFWYVSTVKDLMKRLKDHFDNLEMEFASEHDIEYPGIWHLLKETARETKNISPVLGGALVRSILTGADYPMNLYQGVIGRIRADHRVNYLRASILKAVLKRNYNKEVPMSLDTEKKDTAYLLGRLFAVLEKAQLDALGKINTTIKDRFFSSASATPASVFPRLIRLSQHHIGKAEYGYQSDNRIADIIDHIDSFPAHMNLQEQGLFAIAYYQQKYAIYRGIKDAAQKKNINKIQGEENE